ncbi:hypothetical protein P9112_002562 [Eukaryota sp. TZLM1-RC]
MMPDEPSDSFHFSSRYILALIPTWVVIAFLGGRHSLLFVGFGVLANLLSRITNNDIASLSSKLITHFCYFMFVLLRFISTASFSFSIIFWLCYISIYSTTTSLLILLTSAASSLFPPSFSQSFQRLLYISTLLSSLPGAHFFNTLFFAPLITNTAISYSLSLITSISYVFALVLNTGQSLLGNTKLCKLSHFLSTLSIHLLPLLSMLVNNGFSIYHAAFLLSLGALLSYLIDQSQTISSPSPSPKTPLVSVGHTISSAFVNVKLISIVRFIIPLSLSLSLLPGFVNPDHAGLRGPLVLLCSVFGIPLLVQLGKIYQNSEEFTRNARLLTLLVSVLVSLMVFAFFGVATPLPALTVTILGSFLLGYIFYSTTKSLFLKTFSQYRFKTIYLLLISTYSISLIHSYLTFSHLSSIPPVLVLVLPLPLALAVGTLAVFLLLKSGESHLTDVFILLFTIAQSFVECLIKSLPHEHSLLPPLFIVLSSALILVISCHSKLSERTKASTRAFIVSLAYGKLVLIIPTFRPAGDVIDWFFRVLFLSISVTGSLLDYEKVRTLSELVFQHAFFGFLSSFSTCLILLPPLLFSLTGVQISIPSFFLFLYAFTMFYLYISTLPLFPSFATWVRFGEEEGKEVMARVKKFCAISIVLVFSALLFYYSAPRSVFFDETPVTFGGFFYLCLSALIIVNSAFFAPLKASSMSKFTSFTSKSHVKLIITLLNSLLSSFALTKWTSLSSFSDYGVFFLMMITLFFALFSLFNSLPQLSNFVFVPILSAVFGLTFSICCFIIPLFRPALAISLLNVVLISTSISIIACKAIKRSSLPTEFTEPLLVTNSLNLGVLWLCLVYYMSKYFVGFSPEVFLSSVLFLFIETNKLTSSLTIMLAGLPFSAIFALFFDPITVVFPTIFFLFGVCIIYFMVLFFVLFGDYKLNHFQSIGLSIVVVLLSIPAKSIVVTLIALVTVIQLVSSVVIQTYLTTGYDRVRTD